RIQHKNIEIGYTGTTNTLAGWGLLADSPRETRTTFLRSGFAGSSVMSPIAGAFEPLTNVGQAVRTGEAVGRIHSLDALDQPPVTVCAESAGIVVGQRAQAHILRGDFLLHLGEEVEESELLKPLN
ncbi:MAG: hypothetical protein CL386_07605, partial [Acidiferrobacter sp.]|nr:hypothetical protein [Acidiferrobacter sp.]